MSDRIDYEGERFDYQRQQEEEEQQEEQTTEAGRGLTPYLTVGTLGRCATASVLRINEDEGDRESLHQLTPLQEYRRDIARGKEQDEKDRAWLKIFRKAWKDWADKEKL